MRSRHFPAVLAWLAALGACGLVALGCSSKKPAHATYSFATADGSVAEVRFNGTPVGRTPLVLTIEDLRPHLHPAGEGPVKVGTNEKGSSDYAYVSTSVGSQSQTLRTLGDGTFRLGVWTQSDSGPVSGELDLRVVSIEDGEALDLAVDVPSTTDVQSVVASAARVALDASREWKFRRRAAAR